MTRAVDQTDGVIEQIESGKPSALKSIVSARDWLRPRLPPDLMVESRLIPNAALTKLPTACAAPTPVMADVARVESSEAADIHGKSSDVCAAKPGSPRGVTASATRVATPQAFWSGVAPWRDVIAVVRRLPMGIVSPSSSDCPDSTVKFSGRPVEPGGPLTRTLRGMPPPWHPRFIVQSAGGDVPR